MEKFKEFVSCYLDAWRKYVKFDGRATRKDYWGFFLINILVSVVLGLVEAILGMDEGFFSSLYTLAVICPNISLCTRRLHDGNRSGWWQLAYIIPLLNFYLLYMLWIKPSTPGENKFGAPTSAAAPVYAAYSVPVANEFSAHEMCPLPKVEAAVAAPVAEAKCADCGEVLEPGAKFCANCGAAVNK